MKINIIQPIARIRAICVIFALLLVPGIMQAESGGGTTSKCAPGLYIYGDNFGKTDGQYIYKPQRNIEKSEGLNVVLTPVTGPPCLPPLHSPRR